jgi:hypothetical protein
MSQELGIPVRLGNRMRILLIDLTALQLLRDTFGVRIDSASMMAQYMTLTFVRQCVWVGCLHEDARITYEQVCHLVTEANAETFHILIAKAMHRGLGVRYGSGS